MPRQLVAVVELALIHPQRLWTLLGLLALFWLALPPRPRRAVGTAHWGPWQRALERAGHRPVRLRRLRFWLLASAFALAVVAWAGLRIGGREGPLRLEVVLDGSASMAARDEGGPLLAQARRAVTERWLSLAEHVEVAVVEVGAGVRLWRGRGGQLASGWAADHAAGGEGRELAGLGRGEGVDVQRWVLTDGGRGVPDVGAVTVLASGGANAAVEERGVIDRWPLPGMEVRVTVRHQSGPTLRGRVSLEGAIQVVEPMEVVLEPGGRFEARWSVERLADGGEMVVRWDCANDALGADDAIAWRLAPLPRPRITVLSDGDGGAWGVAAAELLAERTGGAVVEAAAGAEVAFLIVDGGRLDLAGVPRGLCFGTLAGAGDAEPWIGPRVADWNREHPLTAGLDFSELRVGTAWPAAIPPAAEVLVAGEDGPLIALVEGEDGAFVHTAFRLGDSNLPLLAAFPQLLQRCFAAAWGATRSVEPLPGGARDVPATEGVLPAVASAERDLAPFGAPPWDPGVWLLALAGLLIAIRVYT